MTEQKIYPGTNPSVILNHYNETERNIITKFANEWYITHGGSEVSLGATSSYKYMLLKPTDVFKEMFNLDLEIVLIFSAYENFDVRTVLAFDYVVSKYQQLRLEKICFILLSGDNSVVEKVENLIKDNQESQIVIPFSYDEILNKFDTYLIRNRFKQYFYSRDLFAFEAPLKKEFYFFGRTNLIQKITNRHHSNENSAIFGLRKSGKTSLIFGIKRQLSESDYIVALTYIEEKAFDFIE